MKNVFRVICLHGEIESQTRLGEQKLFESNRIYSAWNDFDGTVVKEIWGVNILFKNEEFGKYFKRVEQNDLLNMFVKDLQQLSDIYGLYIDANFTAIKDENYRSFDDITLVLDCIPCEYVLDKPNEVR